MIRNCAIHCGDAFLKEEDTIFPYRWWVKLPQWQKIQYTWSLLKTGAASLRACEFAEKSAARYRNQGSVIQGRMTPNVRR